MTNLTFIILLDTYFSFCCTCSIQRLVSVITHLTLEAKQILFVLLYIYTMTDDCDKLLIFEHVKT